MPANKKPTKILELSGATKKNAKRHAGRINEPQPHKLIGECPSHLTLSHKVIWDELRDKCADGVLSCQDEFAVELLVMGLHDVRHGIETDEGTKNISSADRDRVFKQLGKFGLTPSERSNVIVGDGGKEKVRKFGNL